MAELADWLGCLAGLAELAGLGRLAGLGPSQKRVGRRTELNRKSAHFSRREPPRWLQNGQKLPG